MRARWPCALVAMLLLGSPAALACDQQGRSQGGAQGGGDESNAGNGNRGYDGEGGRSGSNDQRGDRNCRNVCGNTIVVPPAPGAPKA